MKERPILFNGEMVRAILDGRKTQTRRLVPERILDKYYDYDDYCNSVMPSGVQCKRDFEKGYFLDLCPSGQVGDRLWVRESHSLLYGIAYTANISVPEPLFEVCKITYAADGVEKEFCLEVPAFWIDTKNIYPKEIPKKRPSIHMPKWASRITLEITDVRVEKLQDITPSDAVSEGITHRTMNCPKVEFQWLWDSIYEKRSFGWDTNPWVWAITFKRVK